MTKNVKNISASVRARLLNLSRSTGHDFHEILIRYAIERFLVRLAKSQYYDKFVLKGAMLYIQWNLDNKRSTMDLDLLGFGSPDFESLKQVFHDICSVGVLDDGLVFDADNLRLTYIREESVYDGIRAVLSVGLGVIPIRLQVDIGFGDQVTPPPRLTEFPTLLSGKGPIIRSYTPETVIAEKFNAMVVLGMANSRMKDYYDIWLLSRSFDFDGAVLSKAIQATFVKRQTIIPTTEPICLSDEFGLNQSKQFQWHGFIRKQRKQVSIPDLQGVLEGLRDFLMPLLLDQINIEQDKWNVSRGWYY